MSELQTIALVGISGYGESYLQTLLDPPAGSGLKFVAGIDPFADRARRAPSIRNRGIPLFPTLDAMYEKVRPNLVVLASPIQYHSAQTLQALAQGIHVLCEKPVAATVAQALDMRNARDAANRLVAIGFQWSFCPTIHALKADIRAGVLGKPKRLRTLVLWPRGEWYYARNKWAGRKYDEEGRPVFDSPVNNAAAHYLHNMLYVLGSEPQSSAKPATVRAELYRANAVENYDTAAINCMTTDGVEVHFVATHATAVKHGPVLDYEFEDGVVHYTDAADEPIVAHFKDGRTKSYGVPCSSTHPDKLLRTVMDIQTSTPTLCSIEASLPHALIVEAAAESAGEIVTVPPEFITIDGDVGSRVTSIQGIADVFGRCHDESRLPSDLGIAWARASKSVTVKI